MMRPHWAGGANIMKAKIHQDVWVGVFIIAACVFFFAFTSGKPGNSMLMPVILLTVLALLAIPVIVGGVRKTKSATPENPVDNSVQIKKLLTPFAAFLFIAGYVFLFWLAGYFAATAIFLPLMMLHFRLRSPLQISLVSLGFVVCIYALFVKQLNVPVLDFGHIGRLMNL
jgi:hypothetical protein